MRETLLKKMYARILSAMKKQDFRRNPHFEEKISERERREIKRLRAECLKGEAVKWEEVKKELVDRM